MKAKFHIVKRITDLERPTKNSKEELEITVAKGEEFGLHDGTYVFKLLDVRANGVQVEYDRHYLVKNEHRGYEYSTIFYTNETKQITSMWGKFQTTFVVTFIGVE